MKNGLKRRLGSRTVLCVHVIALLLRCGRSGVGETNYSEGIVCEFVRIGRSGRDEETQLEQKVLLHLF